jgi:hypothetical protein
MEDIAAVHSDERRDKQRPSGGNRAHYEDEQKRA